MEVHAGMDPDLPLREVARFARRVERMGFDGLHVPETVHDSLAVSALALDHTTTLRVRTAVTVAFPRSPMLVAYAVWGLAGSYPGRFELGLGTQVRGNIEGRYGVRWEEPIGRMREYVGALRETFRAFQHGGPLRVEGRHYRMTRLQPYFNPGPVGDPEVRIWLGGVNEGMTRLAGEVADGFLAHPTGSSPLFLERRCRPTLEAGANAVGRATPDILVSPPVATGPTPSDVEAERFLRRRTLAFLFSTRAYRGALELHGWQAVGDSLRRLAKAGRWDDMDGVIPGEMVEELVPSGTFEDLAEVLARRYGGSVTGIALHPPSDPALDERMAPAIAALRGGSRPRS